MLEHADGLTHIRNAKNFQSVADRVDHLALGGGELLKAVHVGDMAVIPSIAAKVALRIFTVLQGLNARSLFVQRLMEKFPASGCSYCGKKPCACRTNRPTERIGTEPSEEQRQWSLADWQHHLKILYGSQNNAHGGLLWSASRLTAEIKEVVEARMRMDRESSVAQKQMHESDMLSELVDSFAWVIAVCNEIGADLEEVFVRKYGSGCEHCGKYPCECGKFDWKDERSAESY